MFKNERAFGFGLDNIAIFRRDGMNTKVPNAEIDDLVRDDFHKRVLAKVERLLRSKLHPVSTGKNFRGSFDYILLRLSAAEQTNAKAGNIADTCANVSTDDDIAVVG